MVAPAPSHGERRQRSVDIAIIDTDTSRAADLATRLRRVGCTRCAMLVPQGVGEPQLAENEMFDVVLINVEDPTLLALTYACLSMHGLGSPEPVFFATHLSDPAVLAIREALRADRLVPADRLAEWMSEAADSLAKLARARREQRSAMQALEQLPLIQGTSAARADWSLYEAEGRFRETYVRALLLVEGTRKAAAQRARVPYRTFIHILSKLGITEKRYPDLSIRK